MPNIATESLLYRNQFILGPSFVDRGFESWKRIRFNESLCMTVHPDLSTCNASHQGRSILLLGFILDPENPQATDQQIISRLIRSFSAFDQLVEETAKLGGRWILIVDDGHEIKLFNDATGLRQVFFTQQNRTGQLWCASQAGLIADVLKLTANEEAVNFIDWYRAKSRDYRWPGDTTLYREIKHLLPNHYLNLSKQGVRRFWPNKALTALPLDEAVAKIPPILSGLMASAANRFDLVVALSAGLDSRLMLAACRDVKDLLL